MVAMPVPDFGPRFPLGRVVATPNVLARIPPEDIRSVLVRHVRGDWGNVGSEDRKENERSLQSGFLLLSVYPAGNSVRFRILTGAVRSSTAVLLHEDYYLLKEDKNHAGIVRLLG